MIHWYFVFIPAITALINRFWRGEAGKPRWAWYSFMVLLAMTVCGLNLEYSAIPMTLAWTLFFAGYAMLPWQAMFSAVNGQAPGRKDAWWIQWMQTVAATICDIHLDNPSAIYSESRWRAFGMVYGTLRAMFMAPGILALEYLTRSPLPAVGLLGFGMGVVYYLGYRLAKHFNIPIAMGVPFAEIGMGWWLGTYILIVSAAVAVARVAI